MTTESKKLYLDESSIQGKGLFTKNSYSKGQYIAFIKGKLVSFDPKNEKQSASIPTWYGVSKTLWIDPEKNEFSFLNHSCNPNCAIIGTKKIVARRAIMSGEELTIDYSMTDADINWTLEYKCQCKSKKCRGIIKSIQHLPPQVVRAHMPLIPKYFIRIYQKHRPNAKIN